MRSTILYVIAAVAIASLLAVSGCSKSPTGGAVVNEPQQEERTFLNPNYQEVSISQYYFKPKNITIYQGDRIKWVNEMPFVKQVWIWGQEPSPVIKPGKSWSYVFLEPGIYKYRDKLTGYMEGNVTVLPYEERPDVKAGMES